MYFKVESNIQFYIYISYMNWAAKALNTMEIQKTKISKKSTNLLWLKLVKDKAEPLKIS